MKVLVDADACPVKAIVVNVSREKNIPVIMLIDTSHALFDDGYSEVIMVDKARDSVDMALVNRAVRDDVVVTQDYGLAAMALAKGARAIHQNGMVYSNQNMDRLLFERHLGQKIRRAGGRTSGPPKRTKEDDVKFEKAFRLMMMEG